MGQKATTSDTAKKNITPEEEIKQELQLLCNVQYLVPDKQTYFSSIVLNEGYSIVKRDTLLDILKETSDLLEKSTTNSEPFVRISYQGSGSITITNEIKEKFKSVTLDNENITKAVDKIIEKLNIKVSSSDGLVEKVNLIDNFMSKLVDELKQQKNENESLEIRFSTLTKELAQTHTELEKVRRELNQENQSRMKAEIEIKEKDERIQELIKEKEAAILNLQTLQRSMELLNSGEVINSQAQEVVEKCTKLITNIDSKCFDFIMETGLPEIYEKYLYYLSNTIFQCLFENPTIEKKELFEISWNKFLNSAENDECKNMLLTGESIFSEIVSMAKDLEQATQSLRFPKISLLWIGIDGEIYSSKSFKLIGYVDYVDVKEISEENSSQPEEEIVSVLPALVLGENKKAELIGTAFKRIKRMKK
ncbi:predicted protein [Naegleria gruberi]|uniref:Predicted protein n=1 Tax=Naegleria gruberi TaxID=5762 RepID=D2VC57_NAEGR|nr:uncharacterized protein NAEGRDRAFT_48352 [Naegleria gruberi]EFC45689.1 predicted protein [Naegleria gruberi]|eukprot:XP_002678433.1 predicted protein [Naegleria gruberi strain NEG-M]